MRHSVLLQFNWQLLTSSVYLCKLTWHIKTVVKVYCKISGHTLRFFRFKCLIIVSLFLWLYLWLCISPRHVMKTSAAIIYFSVLWYILYIKLYTTYFSLYIFCMPSSCLRSLVNVVCGTLAGQGQGIGSFSYWSAC